MTFILDWGAIRPLDGGRDKGFEQLCSQLADCEKPSGSNFVRKGTPDAGVECYAVLPDGSEWAWQSKYFDSLGNSQWQQIDQSVRTAIEKHPLLVRYFVCIPLDRPDARIIGQKSAKDKWDERVKKWSEWAADRGMAVEFVYWGNHELLERLARPEHVGRVRFWFDTQGFDAAWFKARLDEAVQTAGPRYTPEIHVDLPVAFDFGAFGRTQSFFDHVKANALSIRKQLRVVQHWEGTVDATVNAAVESVSATVQAVLGALGEIELGPAGSLPFKAIMEQVRAAKVAAEELSQILREHELELDAADEKLAGRSSRRNPFHDRRFYLLNLTVELETALDSLIHADGLANSALMLLQGEAGTGKTHLLCDVAQKRVAAGRPTVLLMGQQFVSNNAPWTQALQQLDLASLSAEEFVGALEAAAQAAGSRALVLIDALNEGAGRTIWPSHLEAFLAHLERSPWIGVVLAVRTSYEEAIVPVSVRSRACAVLHRGFSEHEYDAAKTFFVHYGLELPSTPLLAPEFRNPLFLKTLCQGLNVKGERRLPRGSHGITAVFDLYLASVNEQLAKSLDFDARTPLVRRALEVFSEAMLDSGQRWLTLSQAGQIVNSFLPGRGFKGSLYRGLVVEGVLVEEGARRGDTSSEEIVFVAYERFADHLAAKTLLDRHLDPSDPSAAFAPEGGLVFVCDGEKYVSPGLLEALCIQIPERVGTELSSIAPDCTKHQGMGNAFRQSLIWRTHAAFSDNTRVVLNNLCRSEYDLRDSLDVLLTVATLPGHPLNAEFLDTRLRQDTMADRDAWWSVYLHQAWGYQGAVDRLVDWASSLDPAEPLDDEVTELCAVTLSWMLTTSNRFLRDRATKALVNLLTGRLPVVARLIERFAEVDDPYVAERVYAVAYGVAMRCHDPSAVGGLAMSVYQRVFASGSPPPHILLRDYARGVVERALYLRSPIDIALDRIRPPYKSTWPTIPTEEDIQPFLPDRSKGSYDSGELEWGRNRIGNSVMNDDFAFYVIGTNSSSTSSDWLALRLDEPPWKPPLSRADQLNEWSAELSVEEKKAWDQFEVADEAYVVAAMPLATAWLAQHENIGEPANLDRLDIDTQITEFVNSSSSGIAALGKRRAQALEVLEAALTPEHARRLGELWVEEENDYEIRQPPGFDLRQVQRFILKRVFDFGWTEERFGYFDRFIIGPRGREASKAERIGKKYQWIAYHEIMAFISDHFQYRERFQEEEGDQAYEGPWQNYLRDIDPSCTLRSVPGGTGWQSHSAAWWGTARYDAWGDTDKTRDWLLNNNDLPKVEELLLVTNPDDDSRWLNGHGYFNWQQPSPVDQEPYDVERREIWYMCTGYLVQEDDAQAFLKWAEGVDFWGRWMPDVPGGHGAYLGEHAWAPASRYFQKQYYGDDGWTQPDHGCPVKVRTVASEYLYEDSGFDCSADESYTLRLPISDLVTGFGIQWGRSGADFADADGQLAAQDPTVHADGPSAFLLREDLLREFLTREKLMICWAILGEKRILGAGLGAGPHHPAVRMSGAYVLGTQGPVGFVKRIFDDHGSSATSPKVLDIYRSET